MIGWWAPAPHSTPRDCRALNGMFCLSMLYVWSCIPRVACNVQLPCKNCLQDCSLNSFSKVFNRCHTNWSELVWTKQIQSFDNGKSLWVEVVISVQCSLQLRNYVSTFLSALSYTRTSLNWRSQETNNVAKNLNWMQVTRYIMQLKLHWSSIAIGDVGTL